jgi:DnaK suppressor protein
VARKRIVTSVVTNLLKQQEVIHQTIESHKQVLTKSTSGTDADPADQATTHEDRVVLVGILNFENKKLTQTVRAISRAQTNAYGICETCGKQIDPERLEIFPETTFCVNCKKLQEKK